MSHDAQLTEKSLAHEGMQLFTIAGQEVYVTTASVGPPTHCNHRQTSPTGSLSPRSSTYLRQAQHKPLANTAVDGRHEPRQDSNDSVAGPPPPSPPSSVEFDVAHAQEDSAHKPPPIASHHIRGSLTRFLLVLNTPTLQVGRSVTVQCSYFVTWRHTWFGEDDLHLNHCPQSNEDLESVRKYCLHRISAHRRA